jgi:hypothetical protein
VTETSGHKYRADEEGNPTPPTCPASSSYAQLLVRAGPLESQLTIDETQ